MDPERIGPRTEVLYRKAEHGTSAWTVSWLEPELVLVGPHAMALPLMIRSETRGRLFAACVAAQLAGEAPPVDPDLPGGGPVRILRIDGEAAGWYAVGGDGSDDGGRDGADLRMEIPRPLR